MKRLQYTVYGLLAALLLTTVGVGLIGWHNGYRAYAVRTGSMTPTYPTGALVVDRPTDGSAPGVGEVITFRTSQGLVTHRVHALTSDSIETKGDANRTADAWPTQPQHVVGVVSWGVAYLGYVLVFFQQPTGIASLMLLAVSVWCAWTVFFPSKEERSADASRGFHDARLQPSHNKVPALIVLPEGDNRRSGLLTV